VKLGKEIAMKVRWGLIGLGVTACAACCAPLILPLLAGGGLISAGALGGTLLFGLTLDQVLCFGLPLAALAFVLIAGLRRAFRPKAAVCDCEASCGIDKCPPASGLAQ
jgi:hypothetical protein